MKTRTEDSEVDTQDEMSPCDCLCDTESAGFHAWHADNVDMEKNMRSGVSEMWHRPNNGRLYT